MAAAIDQAKDLLKRRITDIRGEELRLQRALAHLDGGSTNGGRAKARGRGRRTSAPKRAATRKRAPRGQRREQLLVALKEKPGSRPSELARAIGVKPAQIYALIRSARTERLIVKKGKGFVLK
jgi:hypothetical protein